MLVKLAASYRTMTEKERHAYLAQNKRWHGVNEKVSAGMLGTGAGVMGGALAHDSAGQGTKLGKMLGTKAQGKAAIGGALLGAAAGGTLGHFVAKQGNEMREDRMKNPDRKWLLFDGQTKRIVKKYGK